MTGAFPPLADLLSAHGLVGVPEEQIEHGGYSGAAITHLVRDDGARFVIKRMSMDRDWIMRATADVDCREAVFAAADLKLDPSIGTPNVGAAYDGAEYALLMQDITPDLLPQDRISPQELDRIIEGIAALHRTPMPDAAIPWCELRNRLMLLTPAGAEIAGAYGAPVAADLVEGWRLFERHAPAACVGLIQRLFSDVSPLLDALSALTPRFLHGDLKLDNIGIAPGGRVWLIDWAMTMMAPPAVELGWFLAINSRRLPVSLDEVLLRYDAESGLHGPERERHDALAIVCGLLLRGWRKALDAESGESAELAWWCDGAERGAAFL